MISHGLITFTPLIMKYAFFNKTYIQYFVIYLHGHVHVYFLLYYSVSICCSLNFSVFVDFFYVLLGQVKNLHQINDWNLNDGNLLSCPYILFELNQIQYTIFVTKPTHTTSLLVFTYTYEAITPTCLFIELIYLCMSFRLINCYGLYKIMLKTCIFILMIILKHVFNNKHALSDLYTSVYRYNWIKFYHYSLLCENTDPHTVYRYNYCNNHDPKMGHYYIFNNYLFLKKNCLWYILIYYDSSYIISIQYNIIFNYVLYCMINFIIIHVLLQCTYCKESLPVYDVCVYHICM